MNEENKVYEYYLGDLGILIKEYALEAQKIAQESGTDFDVGYLMAYSNIVSLMQSQADAFQIDMKKLKLDDIDPMRDLTTRVK